MKKLCGYYQNVRGLRRKIASGIKNGFTLANHDFVSLTETWLNDGISSSEIFDDTYNVFRADRSIVNYNILKSNINYDPEDDITGGGCLFAIKNDISAIRLTAWEEEILFENIWLKINTHNNSKIFINTVYIPPWANHQQVKTYLEHLHDIVNVREPYSRFVILGDFNLPSITWFPSSDHFSAITYEGRTAIQFLNLLNFSNLTQKNGINNINGRILDLVITNIPAHTKRVNGNNIIVKVDVLHPPIQVVFECNDIKFLKSNKSNKLNFFKANYEEINAALHTVDWNRLFQNVEINEAVNIFYNEINDIIREFVPIITPKSDEYPKWFSCALINMIKDKEYYRNKMKKPNGNTYIELFGNKRKEVKKEKKLCLMKYINNIEPLIQNNPKCFFAYTKAQKQSNKLPSAMFYKTKQADDMKETANLFAEYFSSVYDTHSGTTQIPHTNQPFDFDVNLETIITVISAIDPFKTNSPDGIPGIFYKNTIDNIKIPLLSLFNLAVKSMQYPCKWKLSYVSPIFKSGNNTNIENYRPISILPAIAKIFDKIIYFYIRDKTLNLLTEHQHGFRAGKSTLSNLLEFSEYTTHNMMGGGQVDAVFMDLSKAFDKINHSILLSKLLQLQLHPNLVCLIQSYLNNRIQIVCVYGEKSSPIMPKSSVPQGSILSPLLFALFINDLPQLIDSKILLFADDLKVFRKIHKQEEARQLQRDIETIVNWCRTNHLQLNVSKCNVMSFTRRHESTFQHFNYNINGASLNRVTTLRDLGVMFDTKLTFQQHIKNITTKAYRMLGFIARSLNKFIQLHTYKILYFAYVRSNLEYCSPVWSPYYDVHVNSIEKVQKRFTRSIFKKFHYPAEKYNVMRDVRLGILSLEDRRSLTDELVLYKIMCGTIETTLNDRIRLANRVRVTRQNHNIFYLPFVTNNVEFHSPLLRMQRQHDLRFFENSLDEPSFCAFKRYTMHQINQNRIIFDYEF